MRGTTDHRSVRLRRAYAVAHRLRASMLGVLVIAGCASPLPKAAPGLLTPQGTLAQLPASTAVPATAASSRPGDVATRLPPIEQVAYVSPVNVPPVRQARLAQADELPRPPGQGYQSLSERLQIPPELPGANAPPLLLPPVDLDQPERRSEMVEKLFPNPPRVPQIAPPPTLNARPAMSLKQLENMALNYNPLLVQAAGDVTIARGGAIQAGVHPNPTVGYEADTVGSAGTRNYQGVFATQTVRTAGKLRVARAAANVDLMNAQLNLRRQRIDVLTQVRASYFNVLVAQEALSITNALVRFTTEAFRIQVDQLKLGQATAYEPAQLRTLAVQARAGYVQAQNRYVAAWKQLAAAIGTPDLPPSELEGRADMPVPVLAYEPLLARILALHTDVLAAGNMAGQSRLQLRLQELTPIPDVQVYATFQRDFTTPSTPRTTYNMQVGLPLPIFDRNQGNILSAQGRVQRAAEQLRVVRNDLTNQLASAFERFETSRIQLQLYREQILPDLARAYRGIYERHQQESDQVGFGDVIVAQTALGAAITTYIGLLGGQWTAATDIAGLAQVEEFSALYDMAAIRPETVPTPPPVENPPHDMNQGGMQR